MSEFFIFSVFVTLFLVLLWVKNSDNDKEIKKVKNTYLKITILFCVVETALLASIMNLVCLLSQKQFNFYKV